MWQCHCHGLGLVSLRAARERLHPRSAILSSEPRKQAVDVEREGGGVRQQAQAEKLTLLVADSKAGYLGVCLTHPGQARRYQSRVWCGGKQVSLGYFATTEVRGGSAMRRAVAGGAGGSGGAGWAVQLWRR